MRRGFAIGLGVGGTLLSAGALALALVTWTRQFSPSIGTPWAPISGPPPTEPAHPLPNVVKAPATLPSGVALCATEYSIGLPPSSELAETSIV